MESYILLYRSPWAGGPSAIAKLFIFNFIRRNKNDSSKTIIKRKNKENNLPISV